MTWTEIRPSSFPVNARRIYVALGPRGEFYLNHGALIKLGEPSAVKLMYDAERKLIGIAPALTHTKDTFRLRYKDGEHCAGRNFAASPFCHAIGLLPDRTIQFRDPRIEDGLLILDPAATVFAPRRGTLKNQEESRVRETL